MTDAPRIVTLTTDFGTDDTFVGEMKGAILAVCPWAAIVDLTHAVPSHDVAAGAWICGELTEEERRLLGRKWKNARLASPASSVRRPAFLAELAWKRWLAGDIDDPHTLAPIYLHINDPIPDPKNLPDSLPGRS